LIYSPECPGYVRIVGCSPTCKGIEQMIKVTNEIRSPNSKIDDPCRLQVISSSRYSNNITIKLDGNEIEVDGYEVMNAVKNALNIK
jgi:hypothetical protein